MWYGKRDRNFYWGNVGKNKIFITKLTYWYGIDKQVNPTDMLLSRYTHLYSNLNNVMFFPYPKPDGEGQHTESYCLERVYLQ